MAHIKCRYGEIRCGYGSYELMGCLCKDPQTGGACERFEDKWSEGERTIISDFCRFAEKTTAEFEGDYKKYHYDYYGITVGRKSIDAEDIEYLEIDGRVLVDESEEE